MSHYKNTERASAATTMGRMQYMQETLHAQSNTRVARMHEQMIHIFAENEELSLTDILAYDKDAILQEAIREAIDTPIGHDIVRESDNGDDPDAAPEEHSSASSRSPRWQQHVFNNAEDAHSLMTKHHSGLLMINIHREHSHAPLSMTESVFGQIAEDIEMFPRIADTILFQGARQGEIEPVVPPAYMRLSSRPQSSRAFGFEVSYMLCIVDMSNRQGPTACWSQRQVAVWQRQDYEKKTSRWCFFGASTLPKDVAGYYMKSCHEEATENPFDIHTLLIMESLATLREYMVFLSGRLEKYTMRFALMETERARTEELTLRDLMSLTKDIMYTKLALVSTRHTIRRVADLHSVLRPQSGFTGSRAYSPDIVGIARVLLEQNEDTRLVIEQLDAMYSCVESLQRSLISLLATRSTSVQLP